MHNRSFKIINAEQQIECALALADNISNFNVRNAVKRALIAGDKEINLYDSHISLSDLQTIVDILQLSCSEVREISMKGNKFRGEHALILAKNTTLTSLNVSENDIGDQRAKVLSKNIKLTELNMRSNLIGIKGVLALADNNTLTTLDVTCNNIGDEGAQAFSKNTTLRTLSMSHNRISDVGAIAISNNITLTSLDVSSNLIGSVGATAFAKNTTLKILNICDNRVDDAGAIALAKNKTLITLGLGSNWVGDHGAIDLAYNNTLRTLDLSNMRDFCYLLGVQSAKALSKNTTLTSLYLGWSDIGAEGRKDFLNAAEQNYSMLNFSDLTDTSHNVKFKPYWDRNKKIGLRETLDQANLVIKNDIMYTEETSDEMANDISTNYIPANSIAIQRLNETLSFMQEETSETAQKIITQLHEKLTQCVEKQISYYKELGEINDTPVDITAVANTRLAIPSSHPNYQSQRILAFQGLYFGYSKSDDKESIRPAFCMALQALCQDDDASPLLVTFKNESDQNIFDTALSTASTNGKILRGTQHLDSDLRKKYLESTVDQWEPIGEQEIEVKARLKVAIRQTLTPIQTPFNLFQLAGSAISTISNNDQSPNHNMTPEV